MVHHKETSNDVHKQYVDLYGFGEPPFTGWEPSFTGLVESLGAALYWFVESLGAALYWFSEKPRLQSSPFFLSQPANDARVTGLVENLGAALYWFSEKLGSRALLVGSRPLLV